ncbi:MAG: hypothetical protein Ct9H300mP28_21860 [Pseudomonadota bacterium]|nr:MAG: hypothetical protein Ct9H300mP28_21860 [Pseudomonadota bacterium]
MKADFLSACRSRFNLQYPTLFQKKNLRQNCRIAHISTTYQQLIIHLGLMRNLTLELYSLETTGNVARKMAEHLFQGSIMLFWGDMGSGKTTFIKISVPDLEFSPKKLLLLHIHWLTFTNVTGPYFMLTFSA